MARLANLRRLGWMLAVTGVACVAFASSAYALQQVPQSTTTTVSSDHPSSATFGEPVTFTASVTASSGTPGGTVTFAVNGVSQPPVQLASGQATLTTNSLPPGTVIVTATYSGNPNFNGSADTTALSVDFGTVSITVSSDKASAVAGEPITLTSVVQPNAPSTLTPTGSAGFVDNATVSLGSASLSGPPAIATLTTTALGAGQHTITGGYHGPLGYQDGSGGNLHLTIGKATTSASVATSNATTAPGEPVTFTATISRNAPSAGGFATGPVTFRDGPDTIGTAPLTNGQATLTTSALSEGAHAITVVYGGDASDVGSDSPGLAQLVRAPSQPQPQTPADQTPPVHASTAFTIASAKGARSGRIALKLNAPGQGRFAALAKRGRKAFGSGAASSGGPGTVNLSIRPAHALAAHHGRLKIAVQVTFTASDGGTSTQQKTVVVPAH